MGKRRHRNLLSRGHSSVSDERERSATRQLAEFSKASLAFRNAVAQLREGVDLQGFLEAMLLQALNAAGTGNGAVVLLEGDPGHEFAHHIVIVEQGVPLSLARKQARGMDRVPFNDALKAFAKHVALQNDGSHRRRDDAIYPPDFSRYLEEQGVVGTYTTALRVGGRMIGWFGVGYFDETPLTPDEVALQRLMADQMAVTMELTRLAERATQAAVARKTAAVAEEQVRKLTRANAALTRSIDVLAGDPAVEIIFSNTLRSMCEQMLGAKGGGTLVLIDESRDVQMQSILWLDGRIIPFPAEMGGTRKEAIDPKLFQRSDAVSRPFMLGRDEIPPEKRDFLEAHGIGESLIVPMVVKQKTMGVFVVGFPVGSPFPSVEDVQLAYTLAQQAALATQLMRLAADTQDAAIAREREAAAQAHVAQLMSANRMLSISLDTIADGAGIETMLATIVRVLADELSCSCVALCLRNPETDLFEIVSGLHEDDPAAGRSGDQKAARSLPPDSYLWRSLMDDARPVVIARDELPKGEATTQTWMLEHDVQTMLGVPLIQRGTIIGCFALCFAETRKFSPDHLLLLQTLAHQATLAVHLERLSGAAQQESRERATIEERTRIARDLHDTLAQGLTGILMHLQASQRTADPEATGRHVGAALDAARCTLVDARRSVHALRSIERLDFGTALRAVLATTFAGSAVVVAVTIDGPLEPLPETVENELLRIAQEAGANAIRHARAGRFEITLQIRSSLLMFSMQDDGIGFDTGRDRDGFGITGIFERSLRIGARVNLESTRGLGTRIVVSVPVPRSKAEN